MDFYDDIGRDRTVSESPIPIPRAPRASRWSGWLIGAVIGALVSLWAFPAVRYTLTAQMEFALAEDSVPWISSLDAGRIERELPRLDYVAARNPDDYLLQVGRATAFAATGGLRTTTRGRNSGARHNDHPLSRLALITRAFATTPGAYAHLARYLMGSRVRIQRAELSVPNQPQGSDLPSSATILPDRRDVKIMVWALESGERLDSDNAFWPAMLAATFFAANEDDEALDALSRAARRPHWDAYIYEEILGQWRLFSAAYGDHGATQQIGPLSLVVFPHLHELRRMAEMARWHAERYAALGDDVQAARIRRNLGRLGVCLRDTAGWAFEALYGTDLFFIACTDGDSTVTASLIRTPKEWETQAAQYHHLLQGLNREFEFKMVRTEVENSCNLRKRVDLARYDASYPGIPPGIPLMPLFGNWMAGICLVQQALGLLVAAAAVRLWSRLSSRPGRWPVSPRSMAFVVVSVVTFTAAIVFFTFMTTPRVAGILLMGLTMLAIAALEAIWRSLPRVGRWLARRIAGRPASAPSSDTMPAHVSATAAVRWTNGTTVRILLLIVLPYLALLYTHRGELSGLHPVAILLTSLTGVSQLSGVRDAVDLALLGCALPILLPLTCALWGLYRGVSPLSSALLGIQRLVLPCLVCLVATYAVMLNRMLVLDAEASQAIQKAAQNDRQWVLTHGAENPF